MYCLVFLDDEMLFLISCIKMLIVNIFFGILLCVLWACWLRSCFHSVGCTNKQLLCFSFAQIICITGATITAFVILTIKIRMLYLYNVESTNEPIIKLEPTNICQTTGCIAFHRLPFEQKV